MPDRPPIDDGDAAPGEGRRSSSGPGSGPPPARPTAGRGRALRDGARHGDRGAGAARAGEPGGSVLGGGRAGAGAPPLFFRSFSDFLRVLPAAAGAGGTTP